MGAQSSGANRAQAGFSSSDIETLQSRREQITESVTHVLRRHLLDNMGELGSARAVPAAGREFVDLFYRRAAAQVNEQDWAEQVSDLAKRGLGAKTAVALIDALYDELQARLGSGANAHIRQYRQHFLDIYMQARQNIVVADHESIHKSLTAALETRLAHEQTLRAALEQERAVALRRAEALAAVAQINLEVAAAATEEALLQTAVTLTNQHFQLYHTHIYLLDETGEQLVLAASAGEAADRLLAQNYAIPLSQEESLAVRAAQMRRALVVHDTQDGTGFLPNPLMSRTRSAVAAPLMARDRLFGVLNVQAARPNYFTEDDINIQAALAVQVAAALYNARSFGQVKLQADIIESAAMAIVTADLDGVLAHANGKALQLFGSVAANTLVGRPLTDFWAEEEAALLQEEGIPAVWQSDSWRYEMTLHALDGRTVPVDLTLFLVRDADGRPLRLAAYLADITERKEAEKIQRELTASLERQLDEINALQRAMSHQGWQAFMTAKERPIQGYQFAQDNLAPVSRQELASAGWLTAPTAGNGAADNRAAVIPMAARDVTIGALAVRQPSGEPLDDEQQQLLADISSSVAEALERARLFEEAEIARTKVEKRAAELAAINAVSEAASSYLDLTALAETIGPMLQKIFHTDTAYIAYYDQKSGMIQFPYYHSYEDGRAAQPPRKLDEKSGFTGRVIRSREPVLFVPEAKELAEAIAESERHGAQLSGSGKAVPTSYLGAPMIAGEEVVGVIGLNTHDDMKIFDEADKRLLVTLARTVGVAALNARSFKESRERAEALAVINQVAEVVAQQLETGQLFTAVHEQIQRAIVSDTFFCAIYNKEQNQFDFPYFFDEDRKRNVAPVSFDPDLEIGKVFTTGKPIIINRAPKQHKAKEKEIKKKLLGKGKAPTNVIFVPLRIGSEIIGVLSVQNYQFREYTLSDQTLLGGIASHVAVGLENIRLFTETLKRAERERLVNKINQKIQSTTSVEAALQAAVRELGKAFGARHTAVQLSLTPKKEPKNGANGSPKRSVSNGS